MFEYNKDTRTITNAADSQQSLSLPDTLARILAFILSRSVTPSRKDVAQEVFGGTETPHLHTASSNLYRLRKELARLHITLGKTPLSISPGVSLVSGGPGGDRSNPAPNYLEAWSECISYADSAGGYILDQFKADAILTFTADSGIFANLVMAQRIRHAEKREAALQFPVYLALQASGQVTRREQRRLARMGFVVWSERTVKAVRLLVPDSLVRWIKEASFDRQRRKNPLKIAVVDDAIISGEVPRLVEAELGTFGVKVDYVCFVYFDGGHGEGKPTFPPCKTFKTLEEARVFITGWNTKLNWFGSSPGSGGGS